jgi:hypothetical protein
VPYFVDQFTPPLAVGLAYPPESDKARTMTTRKKSKQDNPEQSKRFIDMARVVGVDESPEALDVAFKKVIKPKPNENKKANVR